jgi:hypothetical protein
VKGRHQPTAEDLFAAARTEKPSATARRRTLGALGLASAAPVACRLAPGAERRPRGAQGASSRQIALALAVVAVAAAAALVVRREAGEAVPIASEPRPALQATAPTASASNEPQAPSNAPPPVAPTAEPSITTRPHATPITSTAPMTLGDEVAALDGARQALAAGNATGALSALDAYQRAARAPRLASEATLLRIEALLRAGRRAEATAVAQTFADKNPDSPFADRARALTATDPQTPDAGGIAP